MSARDTTGPDVFATLAPVEQTRLADRVVEQIRDLILGQDLVVGSRLPSERSLAQRFGTSRAIVSQALRTLSIMGLVEIRPGSGAYITRNPQTMVLRSMNLLALAHDDGPDDLAELRYWLESLGGAKALDHLRKPDLEAMDAALQTMADSDGRTSVWIAADTIFHASLVSAAGNRSLTALYESVHTSTVALNYAEWVRQEKVPEWLTGRHLQRQIDLHRPILDAARRRDPAALRTALGAHHEALLDHLARPRP
jgi:GntR family transcriptional regulator, transcriptional repressor for pyruvate dehydrogenase complex